MEDNKQTPIPTSASPVPARPRFSYKPLPGFEEKLEALVALYREHPEAIDMGTVTPDVLEDELDAYRATLATEQAARLNLAALTLSRLGRGSRLWSRMLGIYGRAQAAGTASEEMKRAVATIEEFLRPKPKRLEKAAAQAEPATDGK